MGSSVLVGLLPFDCLNFNDFPSSSITVRNGWNFMKHILNIYDHSVVMHVNFHQGALCYRCVIVL